MTNVSSVVTVPPRDMPQEANDVKIVGSKITHKRLWAGHMFHPFLQKVGSELAQLGYLFDGIDATERTFGTVTWVAPLFPGYQSAVEIRSENRDFLVDTSNININCSLLIESSLQYVVNPILHIESFGGNARDEVGRIQLNWLTKNWPKKSPSAWMEWTNISVEESESKANLLAQFILNQGLNFLEYINSPFKLKHALLLPLNEVGGNQCRVSSSLYLTEVYAIVALLSGGFKEECLEPLNQYRKEADDRWARKIGSDADHEICLNRIKVLESWIQAPKGDGIEKYLG